MAALVALIGLATAPGCLAYKMATPRWFSEPEAAGPRTAAERERAVRRRAKIALAVGVAEVAVGALLLAASIHELHDPSPSPPPDDGEVGSSGQVGAGLRAVGEEILGLALLTAASSGLVVAGLGDAGCGLRDLVTASTCDAVMAELDRTDPAPALASGEEDRKSVV